MAGSGKVKKGCGVDGNDYGGTGGAGRATVEDSGAARGGQGC